MIVMVIIRVKIVYINVLMRLVSITPPVMLNLIDYPRLKLIEAMKMIEIIKIMVKMKMRVKIMVKMMVMMIMKVIVIVMIKIMIFKIECIGVIVRLVSRRGGSLNSS